MQAGPVEAGESPAGSRQNGRRRAVFDLVLWCFVIALTPVAMGLASDLVSGLMDRIVRELSRAIAHAKQPRALRAVSFNHPLGCISAAGSVSRPYTGRFRATDHMEPSRVKPPGLTGPQYHA